MRVKYFDQSLADELAEKFNIKGSKLNLNVPAFLTNGDLVQMLLECAIEPRAAVV
jgi:hypothetical protein